MGNPTKSGGRWQNLYTKLLDRLPSHRPSVLPQLGFSDRNITGLSGLCDFASKNLFAATSITTHHSDRNKRADHSHKDDVHNRHPHQAPE